MAQIASIFGYLLNYIYGFCNNYGISIIIFTIILKFLILPISINQQKTMKKSAKIQEKVKDIQEKYKNDPMRLNQETMDLYKSENMSPFSGCLTSIVQILLVLAMFYLVSQPLTYMKKIDSEVVNGYYNKLQEEGEEVRYKEIAIIKKFGKQDDRININMDFLGLDLSDVPSQNFSDWKVYIIPVLYVITSIASMKIINKLNRKTMGKDKKEEEERKEKIIKEREKEINSKQEDIKENSDSKELVEVPEENDDTKEADMMEEMSRNMNIMMPAMSVMIAMIAPLGLALYWLVSNIFSISERLLLSKMIDKEE